jgi:ketosteroid isomerase-like protein
MVTRIFNRASSLLKPGAIAFLSSCLLASCMSDKPPRPSLQEDLAAISNFNERYLKAINDEDIDALAKLTDESHVLTPPGGRPVVGKAHIVDVTGRSFAQFDVKEMWTPEETQVGGDIAFQRGTYHLEMTPKTGGDSRTTNGWFLRIYQRQPSGDWWMTRDMFNIDSSPTSGKSGE